MRDRMNITVIDYGVGNVYSVANALTRLDYNVKVSALASHIAKADALILPGVGAFKAAMDSLNKNDLINILNEAVLEKKKPILGICLGMQMLSDGSYENGWNKGLGWIPGEVKKLKGSPELMVPHVGWNDVKVSGTNGLFIEKDDGTNFYFDHSYYFECDKLYQAASCNYGLTFTAAVNKQNIFGVQFHPEKSQTAGLKLFRRFLNSI